MDTRVKWALFSGTFAVITGGAALYLTGAMAVFQGFLCGINLMCAVANLLMYKMKKDAERDAATLEKMINKQRDEIVSALDRKKGDDYYLSGL